MLAEQSCDLLERGEYGEHRSRAAFPGAVRHDLAAPPGQSRRGLIINSPGRAERGQLAETVPSRQIGANPEIFEHPQQPQTDRSDRWLREPSVSQVQFLRLACRLIVRSWRIDPVRETRVSFVDRASFASARADCIRGNRQANSRSMPTYCDPCPGKSIASGPGAGPIPTKTAVFSGGLATWNLRRRRWRRHRLQSGSSRRTRRGEVSLAAFRDQKHPKPVPALEERPASRSLSADFDSSRASLRASAATH